MTYALPFYRDGERLGELADNPDHYTAQDYTLCYALGVENNNEAQHLVEEALRKRDTKMAHRVTWDSEAGCFFAHTSSRADMVALAAVVAGLVAAGPHPNATLGDMTRSPNFFRRWDEI